MAQHDYVIANGTGAAVRSDLNYALAAIVSNNSGATEPTTMYAYQWWADTTTGLLKLRNGANNAWITLRELDGTLTIEAGTVSAPGLAFASDLNTGVWSPGADQFAIATNGVERVEWGTSEVVFNDGGTNYDFRIEGDTNANLFFVDASADAVGIGTTSPSQLIHGASSGAATLFLQNTSGNNSGITLQNDGQGTSSLTYNRSANTLALAGPNADITFANASQAIVFTTNGEAARIDSSKRLLVGTSSSAGQSCLLQVRSDAGLNAEFFRSADSSGGPYIALTKTRGTAASPTEVSSDDDLGTFDFIGYDGATYRTAARIQAQADGTWTDGGDTTDNPGRLVFSTTADGASSPTERVRITNSGYTKISNTGSYLNASAPYHEIRTSANGSEALNITNSSASDPYALSIVFSGTSPNNATNYFIYCSDSTAQRATIRSNGGLANYQANNVNLSDRNTKKDISPAADTWNCIKEWEIVNYRYKDQPDDADLNLGVIAQQVAESCPEVITVFQEAKEATEDQPAQEERLGVKEQQMYWMAIKALQEAQVRIEQLEAKVAALEAA